MASSDRIDLAKGEKQNERVQPPNQAYIKFYISFGDCNKKKKKKKRSPPRTQGKENGILSLSILRGEEHFDKKKGKGVPFKESHEKEEGKKKEKRKKK